MDDKDLKKLKIIKNRGNNYRNKEDQCIECKYEDLKKVLETHERSDYIIRIEKMKRNMKWIDTVWFLVVVIGALLFLAALIKLVF